MKKQPSRLRALLAGLLLFVLVGSALQADHAETTYFDNSDWTEPVRNLSISALAQDDRGFLWLGTGSGLVRYNGFRFDTYEFDPFSENSLVGNQVQTLYHDSRHATLWVGTYAGLSALDLKTMRFTTVGKSDNGGAFTNLPNQIIVSLYRDASDKLWIGTLSGLARMEGDGTFTRFPLWIGTTAVTDAIIRQVFEDNRGDIWVASNVGLHRFDKLAARFQQVLGVASGTLESDYPMRVERDYLGRFVMAVWDLGVVIYDPVANQVEHIYRLADTRLYSMLIDQRGIIWAGTWGGGLFRIDPLSHNVFRDIPQSGVRGSLTGPIVYSLLEDRTGLIWIGTHTYGLNRYNPVSESFERIDNRLANAGAAASVSHIFEDSSGNYWIGTYNGGLRFVNVERDIQISYRHNPSAPGSLSNDIVRDIVQFRDGSIWIATNEGINRYRGDGTFDKWLSLGEGVLLPDITIMQILEPLDGEGMWLGTYSNGLVRWSPEKGELFRVEVGSSLINDLEYDSRGRLWVAHNGGLTVWQNGIVAQFTWKRDRSGLSGNTAKIVEFDDRGNAWIGTNEGGITVISPNFEILRHVQSRDGLSSNLVTSIIRDSRGYLWVGTNQGVDRVSLEGGINAGLSRGLGLNFDQFSSGALLDSKGYLLFGTTSGTLRLLPDIIESDSNQSKPVITEVSVGRTPVLLDTIVDGELRIQVPWQRNSVRIEFSILDFDWSENQTFTYQLLGFDNEPVGDKRSHTAEYTNLPPGQFRFLVTTSDVSAIREALDRMSNRALGQLDNLTTILFEVEAPPYLQWWAIAIYLGLGLLVVFGVSQFRVARAMKSQVRKLQLVRRDLETANRQLNYMSYHDELSGLGNRRLYMDVLTREWARARRSREPLSLISVDIDFFKRYNDSLGHPAGDRVLKIVSDVLLSSVSRSSDSVCRVGGEEFAVIMANTPREGALAVANEIMRRIENERIHHPDSSVGPFLTVSIGFGSIIPDHRDAQVLVNIVDQALYSAKQTGRNRVVEAQVE